jgi:hypothetical protein
VVCPQFANPALNIHDAALQVHATTEMYLPDITEIYMRNMESQVRLTIDEMAAYGRFSAEYTFEKTDPRGPWHTDEEIYGTTIHPLYTCYQSDERMDYQMRRMSFIS